MNQQPQDLSVNCQAALAYVEIGWLLIPLYEILADGTCACGDPECDPKYWGKHPRISSWPLNASADPKQVIKWWTRWPNANIGVVTGKISNLLVIDVDTSTAHPGKAHGPDSIARYAERFGDLPVTATARSGSGGLHHYFAYPDDGEEYRNRSDALPGVDVRGEGGYIIAPPSNHKSGGRYEWL